MTDLSFNPITYRRRFLVNILDQCDDKKDHQVNSAAWPHTGYTSVNNSTKKCTTFMQAKKVRPP